MSFNVTFGAAWSVPVLYAIERLEAGEIGFGLLTTAIALGGVAATGLYGVLHGLACTRARPLDLHPTT